VLRPVIVELDFTPRNTVAVKFGQITGKERARQSLFFGYSMGFNEDKEAFTWTSSEGLDSIEALRILRMILTYLGEEGISYQLGSGAALLLSQASQEAMYFKAATARPPLSPQEVLRRLPAIFHRELKLHQQAALGRLISADHGANFSVPGAGKTTVALAAYAIWQKEETAKRLLIVGPTSSFMVWKDEFRNCFWREPTYAQLQGPRRDFYYEHAEDYELFLVSYPGLVSDLEQIKRLCSSERTMVILDESHHAKRFRGGQVASAVLDLAPYAARRMVLTGTPMPQSVSDLWTQFTFLWPQELLLGSRDAFEAEYVLGEDVPRVRERVQPFFVRVKKPDLGLPPFHINREVVPLARYQAQIYDALARQFISDLHLAPVDRAQLRDWRRARMVRLLQAASNPALLSKQSREFRIPPLTPSESSAVLLAKGYPDYEVPAKFLRAVAMVKDIVDSGDKAIIWTSFIGNLGPLSALLKPLNPLILYGGIPADPDEDAVDSREQRVRAFRESSDNKVLIAIPAACGESLSLHRVCHNAIFLDRTFKAAEHVQARDRIHRVGLTVDEEVTYHLLISDNTIDEVVDQRLNAKVSRMEELFQQDLPRISLEPPESGQDRSSYSETETDEEVDFQETVEFIKKTAGFQT